MLDTIYITFGTPAETHYNHGYLLTETLQCHLHAKNKKNHFSNMLSLLKTWESEGAHAQYIHSRQSGSEESEEHSGKNF